MNRQTSRDQDEILQGMYMQLSDAQLEQLEMVKANEHTQTLPWKK